MKKLFLGILVLGMLLSGNANAGFFKDFFKGWNTNSTSGCAYDEFGREIECVTIDYGDEGGLTYKQAIDACLSYLRRYADLDKGDGSIGGCI